MSTGLADKLYLCLSNTLLVLRVVRSDCLTVLTVVLLKVLGKWFMTCGGIAVPLWSASYSAACVFVDMVVGGKPVAGGSKRGF
jgi:hypothetical protein